MGIELLADIGDLCMDDDTYSGPEDGEEDNDEVVIERRPVLDENGVDIFKKRSKDKTVDERIRTSRSLKIKYNKWNQVDFTDEKRQDRITIDDRYYNPQAPASVEDTEFEERFHEIIRDSKYKAILLSESDKIVVTYQIINEILLYTYAKLKNEYSLTRLFVLVCEYCGINIQTMWKKLSSYIQRKILEELCEYSSMAKKALDAENKLF